MKVYKSIYEGSQCDGDILSDIIALHNSSPKPKILDPTYSKGNFYKDTNFSVDFKFDILPTTIGVQQSDVCDLPIRDGVIDIVIFDPPFLATKGKSLREKDGNAIVKRFGSFETEKELHEFYRNAMQELYRVLKESGLLIFKCQDKVSSGLQYFSHCFIYQVACEIGYYPIDLIIKSNPSKMTPAWQLKNQKHFRKHHSYFWVFKKTHKKVKYQQSEGDL